MVFNSVETATKLEFLGLSLCFVVSMLIQYTASHSNLSEMVVLLCK